MSIVVAVMDGPAAIDTTASQSMTPVEAGGDEKESIGSSMMEHPPVTPRLSSLDELLSSELLLHTTEVSVIKTVSTDSLKSMLSLLIEQLTALQQATPGQLERLTLLESKQQQHDARQQRLEAQARLVPDTHGVLYNCTSPARPPGLTTSPRAPRPA